MCRELCLLWEAVHPIRRHYTPSDRVHRDVTGALRRNGCSAAWPVRVERGHGKWSITKSVMKLVADEVLHPIGKIQSLLIGLNASERVQDCPVCFGRRLVEGLGVHLAACWLVAKGVAKGIALLGAAMHHLVASAMPS